MNFLNSKSKSSNQIVSFSLHEIQKIKTKKINQQQIQINQKLKNNKSLPKIQNLKTKPNIKTNKIRNRDFSSGTMVNTQIQNLLTSNQSVVDDVINFAEQNNKIKFNPFFVSEKKEKLETDTGHTLAILNNVSSKMKRESKFNEIRDRTFLKEQKQTNLKKINHEIEINDGFLKIKNFLTNQKTQVSLDHFLGLFEKFYDHFIQQETLAGKNLLQKLEIIVDFDNSPDSETLNRLLLKSKDCIHQKLNRQNILSFMQKNYNCSGISDWIEQQKDIFENSKNKTIKPIVIVQKKSLYLKNYVDVLIFIQCS